MGEFDLDNIADHELTNKDPRGSRAEPKGIATNIFQLEGYLAHCKMGKHRTGMLLAAFLIAFFCESEDLPIDEVMRYCCEVLPIIEFASSDEFGCPLVPRGGDFPEKPVQSVERSNLYSILWSSRQVWFTLVLHTSSCVKPVGTFFRMHIIMTSVISNPEWK